MTHGVHFRRALGERQHHEQRLLGDRRRVGGARDHQRHLAAAERRHVDGVVADADPRHHLHVPGGFELRLAEAGGAERHAMDRRMLLQHGLEIPGGDQVGKFDEFDVVPLGQKRPTFCDIDSRNEDFLLVGRHFLPVLLEGPSWGYRAAVKGRRRSPRLAGACC